MILSSSPIHGLLLLAQSDAQVHSVWDFVVKGGLMMIPIGIASLIMLTVVVERLIALRRKNIIPDGFFACLSKILQSDDDARREKALQYCKNDASPVANICAAGIKKLSLPVEVVEKHITYAGEWEVFRLRKYLRVLSVIASIAPLMGLVGTIFGMIRAFQTVAISGDALGKTELLAEGIYEAMITTAAGLLVAIPALIFYNWISSKIERLVTEMDRVSLEFVEQFAGRPAQAAPLVPPSAVEAGRRPESPPPSPLPNNSADKVAVGSSKQATQVGV